MLVLSSTATGASLTAVTVRVKVSLVLAVPSLTLTVIVADPFWLAAGFTVTVRLAALPPKTMFALGTSVVLDELPVKVRFAAAVSTSPTVKLSELVALSSLVVWLAISEIVGGSLTGLTVRLTVATLDSALFESLAL